MLTALLFDKAGSSEVQDIAVTSKHLSNAKVLWINLQDATEEEIRQTHATFGIGEQTYKRSREQEPEPHVRLEPSYIRVRALFAPSTDALTVSAESTLDCFVGRNWLVTRQETSHEIVDEFRELATGPGAIGSLDAMSLLATLLELVIVGYSEEFEGIEERLEDFDQRVLGSNDRDIESKVASLVSARTRVGLLRRALAPHRRVFTTLSHTELDAVSTEESAQRFMRLSEQVVETINGARDAREAVVNSFDMLILRTEHRTNEIVKVLTLASILFLPGALVAGIMGMNVNIAASEFVTSFVFWGALAVIVVVGAATLILARVRHWI